VYPPLDLLTQGNTSIFFHQLLVQPDIARIRAISYGVDQYKLIFRNYAQTKVSTSRYCTAILISMHVHFLKTTMENKPARDETGGKVLWYYQYP
jgi:hypothetical protein